MIRHKPIILLVAASALSLMLMPTLAWAGPEAMPPLQGSGPELLKNPGLDGPMWFKSQCCEANGLPINEVQVAEGWTAWWLQIPPSYIVLPENCQIKRVDYGCYWARPEFVDSARTGAANRIHGGNNSQKYFTFGRMHEAGLYQRVTGITPGTQLLFSVYISAWMCASDDACKGGFVSDQPTTMHMRVGIDPTGGTDPFSPSIVWSPEVDSFDRWTQYSVQAVAQGDSVTVFTHSRPEWMTPRRNNDVYVDDASLMAIGAPGASPTPASGGAPAPAAPPPAASQPQAPGPVTRPQNKQRPDGSTVHVVQSGDTLFGIALAYGVTVDQIMQLNRLQPGDYLQIGQELIVKGPSNPSTPTTAPQPTAGPTIAQTPQPTAVAAAPAPGGLCVQAFNDRNGNSLYDENEELVANIKFLVLTGDTEAAVYTTNGVDEPHCFTNLPPRAYTVRVELPKNYMPTTDEQMGVSLAAGQTANVSLGVQPPGGGKAAGSGDASNVFARYGGVIVGIGGVGVLLIAGIVGFFILSRRK